LAGVVSFASAGEKQTDQMLIIAPARNARAICAGICRKTVRSPRLTGAATTYTSIIVRGSRYLVMILTSTVPAIVPKVSAAVIIPILCSEMLCSTRNRLNRKK